MTTSIAVRLVGFVPAVVMGIFDKIGEGFVDGVETIAQNIADAMTAWATWGIEAQLRVLSSGILPSPADLIDSPMALLLGANYGLAVMMLRGLIVIAVVVTMIAAVRRKRTEFASRVGSSALGLMLLALLWFPLWTLLISFVREFSLIGLQLGSDSSDATVTELSDQALAVLTPDNLALQFIAGILNGAVASIVVIELVTLVVMFIILTFSYPLNVAFRPFFLSQYKWATAAIVTIPASIIVMAILSSLQLVLTRGADVFFPFLTGIISLILGLIFGTLIIISPLIVFYMAYNKVEQITGSVDAKFNAGMDVITMPDVNTRQIGNDSTESKISYVKQFSSELPGAIASGENGPGTEAKELGKQIAIQAAMRSGNPVIVAGAVAYTAAKMVGKLGESKANEGGE